MMTIHKSSNRGLRHCATRLQVLLCIVFVVRHQAAAAAAKARDVLTGTAAANANTESSLASASSLDARSDIKSKEEMKKEEDPLRAHAHEFDQQYYQYAVPSFAPSSLAPTPTAPTKGRTATFTFSYTGSAQQWVPVGVDTFTVDAYGAAGGDSTFQSAKGGLGGYISVSNIAASSFVGKTLFIYVGCVGAFYDYRSYTPGLGGGGGDADPRNDDYTTGGGATDLRSSVGDLSSR